MNLPPRLTIPVASRAHRSSAAPWLAIALLLVVASARLASLDPRWLPRCTLKCLTGVPCALCGSTRAVLALCRLDFPAAVALNPLATLAALGAVCWLLAWASDRWLATRWLERAQARRHTVAWWWLGAAALAANWIYVVAAGR
jgi:hypothetical protein